MAHNHTHSHGLPAGNLDRAMALGVLLNLGFVGVEMAVGFYADSLALIADAGHNASDVIGLLLAWGADWLARRPPSRRYTWGLGRVTIYAAFANAVLLFAACAGILWEAVHRLQAPSPVAGLTVIVVAAIGVVINTFTAMLFVRGQNDANVRGAFLHMAADAAVSGGVVLAGIAIMMTGLGWIDPAVSIAIAVVIIVGTWGLFRESVDLALDAVPRGVDAEAIEAALAKLPGVAAMHDLRLWGPSTSQASLTVHLVVAAGADRDDVLASATRLVEDEFHVAHSTIQVEGACP
jgi:cobalt-zinc-cadmium efflux system protein